MSRPRGERSESPYRSRGGLSTFSSWGPKLDVLLRRFEATIPLRRLVKVTWGAIRFREEDAIVSVGVPHLSLQQVIYLQAAGGLIGIPKGLIRDIVGVTMPKPTPASALPTGWEIGEVENLARAPGALEADDPKFERFATAILLEERVRITASQPVTDPAIESAEMVRDGIDTLTEGYARLADDYWLHIGPQAPYDGLMTAIPRCRVKDIVFMGPREVNVAEQMR